MAFGVAERDRRATMIEAGMQNSGWALGIIAPQFNADWGMVIVASLLRLPNVDLASAALLDHF